MSESIDNLKTKLLESEYTLINELRNWSGQFYWRKNV